MKIFRNLNRKRIIKSYIEKLPTLLANDYGRKKLYKPLQVKRSIERWNLSPIYAFYAIAMFSHRNDFDQYYEEINEVCDYDLLRNEVGHLFFGGDTDFSIAELSSTSLDMVVALMVVALMVVASGAMEVADYRTSLHSHRLQVNLY